MLVKLDGIIDFYPDDRTNKHRSQSTWKKFAIIKTDCDLSRYYAWFLEKRFNLILNRNLRGTHITFISDRMDSDLFNKAAETFDRRKVTFYIELTPRGNENGHWWLRVWCPDVLSIREALGLTRDPYFGLHLTLGKANEKNIKHSKYILDCCKRFELLPSDTRKELSEYEIYESIM